MPEGMNSANGEDGPRELRAETGDGMTKCCDDNDKSETKGVNTRGNLQHDMNSNNHIHLTSKSMITTITAHDGCDCRR